MVLKFRITALSRESVPASPQNPNPIAAIRVTASFRAPIFTDPRMQQGHPAQMGPGFPQIQQQAHQLVAQWNAQNQASMVTFVVTEAEGSKLHIDQEFEAQLREEAKSHAA